MVILSVKMKEDVGRIVLTQKVNVGSQINFVAKIPLWSCLSVILI